MAIEEITMDGQRVTTLKELLRPGLKAIFIGLNPATESARRGHYYQGNHGRHFWKQQLRNYEIVSAPLPPGAEDEVAFQCGFGFADLIRRPTGSAKNLRREELSAAISDLALRLSKTGDRPIIVFRYKQAWDRARGHLGKIGYSRMFYMPSPYTKATSADALMKELRAALR